MHAGVMAVFRGGLIFIHSSSVTRIVLVSGPVLGSGDAGGTLNWRRTICEEDSQTQKIPTER